MADKGEGVPQDYTEAVKWLRLGSEQGEVLAQRNLGLMYDAGLGVAQDFAEAAKWYRMAAEKGGAQGRVTPAGPGGPMITLEFDRRTQDWVPL